MTVKLLVHPHPQSGQSVECYIRYLSEVNGYPTALAMLRQLVGASGPFSDKISLEQLERITGLGRDILAEAQLTLIEVKGQPIFRFENLLIPSYQLRAENWHCPHCYREKGYMNGSWRIAWLPVCTQHHCALMPMESTSNEYKCQGKDHFLFHAANDGAVRPEVVEVQMLLEDWLREEATLKEALHAEDSIVTQIDTFLLRALGLNDVTDLRNRKRRYPLKYWPLDYQDTMRFMECLYVQLVEEKRRRA